MKRPGEGQEVFLFLACQFPTQPVLHTSLPVQSTCPLPTPIQSSQNPSARTSSPSRGSSLLRPTPLSPPNFRSSAEQRPTGVGEKVITNPEPSEGNSSKHLIDPFVHPSVHRLIPKMAMLAYPFPQLANLNQHNIPFPTFPPPPHPSILGRYYCIVNSRVVCQVTNSTTKLDTFCTQF